MKAIMIDFTKKKIGIWGLGIVGKSAINFFARYKTLLQVMEKRSLNHEELLFLQQNNAQLVREDNSEHFFSENDLILASPGVAIEQYPSIHDKIITELDILHYYAHSPLIAITGSVGKTSITTLITQLLQHNQKNVAVGGNIGIGMLDLIRENSQNIDYTVLETSSFQLEYCQTFAPHLAIITNLYPNHLDRHKTFENYVNAKLNIVKQQLENDKALLPIEINTMLGKPLSAITNAQCSYFSVTEPTDIQIKNLGKFHTIFWLQNNAIVVMEHGITKVLVPNVELLPSLTFKENWLIICAALYLCHEFSESIYNTVDITLEHRLEKIETADKVTFYNDSKATISESTLQAVRSLKTPTILLLGGVNKTDDISADRKQLIKQLPANVQAIIAFGKEASLLKTIAEQETTIPCLAFGTLEDCFKTIKTLARAGDSVLLSPGGTSYDLFKDYKERGNCFKALIKEYYS